MPWRELGAWRRQSLVLSSQCDVLVEEFEEVIEDWYRNHQEEDLTEFLCANHVLKGKDTSKSRQEEAGQCLDHLLSLRVGEQSAFIFSALMG